MPFECHLKDFVWRSICQVRGWLVSFGMLPDYITFALCKFYCNGCFPFALVVFSLCDFSPIHFAGLVKKHNHSAHAFFRFGRLIFLACKAGCKLDVLEGGSVLFCIGSYSSLIDVIT